MNVPPIGSGLRGGEGGDVSRCIQVFDKDSTVRWLMSAIEGTMHDRRNRDRRPLDEALDRHSLRLAASRIADRVLERQDTASGRPCARKMAGCQPEEVRWD